MSTPSSPTAASSPSAALALVQRADALLAGDSSHRARYACWLGRTALELTVADLLLARGLDPATSSMRSRLGCLQSAYPDRPDVVTRADFAWARLSQACHQHAYELGPTVPEARSLLESVVALTGAPA